MEDVNSDLFTETDFQVLIAHQYIDLLLYKACCILYIMKYWCCFFISLSTSSKNT